MATKSKTLTYGSSTPRLASKPVKGTSLAPVLEALAESLGEPLLPWQSNVLQDACKVDKDGQWIRKTVGVIVARQQGKSHLVRLRVLAGLFIFGEEQIYIIAQVRKLSTDHMAAIERMIHKTPWMSERLKRVVKTNGKEAIEVYCEHYPKKCPSGCKTVRTLGVLAATPDAPRGSTADFLWVDELREISEDVWSAAAPITRARPNAQTWVTSNAGSARSTVLNDIRGRALGDTSPRLGWYEWSAPQGCKIDDLEAIAQANPSLGYQTDIESLMDSIARDHPDTVRTELLCQWIDALDSPWNMTAWDAGIDRTLKMDENLPTYMGLDLVFDRTQAFLVSVQDDGKYLRVFMHSWEKNSPINERELASEIAVLSRKYRTKQIAFDPNTAGFVAPHLSRAGVKMIPTPWASSNFSTMCDVTMSNMNSDRLIHVGQSELRQHLTACARRPASDGGWRIARRASESPISAAVALVMAVGHADAPRTQLVAAVG